MARVRLTKNEIKKQKESLKRFYRYLPMLELKKRQVQIEILKCHQHIKEVAQGIEELRRKVIPWIDVFAEEVSLGELLKLRFIKKGKENVAGIDLPVFLGVEIEKKPYDLMTTPLWVDKGIEVLEEMIALKSKLEVHHQQLHILKKELRIITQRVNLFEKVKIPEAKENIRVIQIYLGELQTAEVVRGKIAKAKLERRKD